MREREGGGGGLLAATSSAAETCETKFGTAGENAHLGEESSCEEPHNSQGAYPGNELPAELLPVDTLGSLQQAHADDGTCHSTSVSVMLETFYVCVLVCAFLTSYILH